MIKHSLTIIALIILVFGFNHSSMAQESDFKNDKYITGLKYPNTPIEYNQEDSIPIEEKALLPSNDSYKGGFNDLIAFITPSPDQEDAGSCLFMSHTGVVEWWLNKIHLPEKKIDLSERYFMNLSKASVGDAHVPNWKTDTILRLTELESFPSNNAFRFTKGWYKLDSNGNRVPAIENEENAKYSVKYNWIVDFNSIDGKKYSLPKFKRDVLFADPESNQWNIEVAPKDIVETVKSALKKNKAPVEVIYNHHGFWHAVFIAGYNDHASSEGCHFTTSFHTTMHKKADSFVKEASQTTDQNEVNKLLKKAKKYRERGDLVKESLEKRGGCRGKGVFYVRDSIYPNTNQKIYDYDLQNQGEETHLNAPVILREYEWLEHLSNHIVQIYVAQ